MSNQHKRIIVGITLGDVNGIGLEVIIKSLHDARLHSNITPIIYGSSRLVRFVSKLINLSDFSFHQITKAEDANPKKVNVIDVWNEEVIIEFGQSTEKAGTYAFKSLEAAVKDLAATKLDVLVTAPINKKNIQSSTFNFPGHTEYLANYANVENPLMLMVYNNLRIGTLTGHIPLKDVSAHITPDKILNKLQVFKKTLIQDFNIPQPKIAVFGLNPHAGDDGLIGDEEKNILIPTLEKAKNEGVLAFGPFPADGFFAGTHFQKFDGVLSMYHDQGLTPFKTISNGDGVNYTAGLPIVRTSPDHGTAYDIAGKNLASPQSFRNAIYYAIDIYKTRQEFKKLKTNQLITNTKSDFSSDN